MLVCVTGISGSGKSTVMNIISECGYKTFIIDEWIHNIYKINEIGFKLIKESFGSQYVDAKGVKRKLLGNLVFSDKKQLAKLNKIMIPLIQGKLVELNKENELIFVELAIYLNHIKDFKKYFSKVICILVKNKLENTNLQKKFSHIKFFPTNDVGNLKNPIKYTSLKCCFLVENYQSKIYLKKQILKILKNFKK